jgi:cyclic beta-1,2-glucan synthetase
VAGPVLPLLVGLSPYARSLLAAPAEQPDPPVRAELFGLHRFESHGRSLARAQATDDNEPGAAGPGFFPRVHDNIAALRGAYDYVALTSRSGLYVTPAAEWLLDNFHLVETQLQEIREGLPRRYYAQLPKLTQEPLQGLPRVYGIAWAYVAHTDSVLDVALFSSFINAYQEVTPLRMAELWALPTTLRVVLLENLRRVADSIASAKAAREVAHAAWDAPGGLTVEQLDELLALMQGHGLARAYLAQLWQRVPADQPADATTLATWVQRQCPDGPQLVTESQAAQVATNLSVSNIITTLRLISQTEWADVIEPLAHPLRVLRQSPDFAKESEITRRQITHALERLARRSGQPERAVAQQAVTAATRGSDEAQRTVAWHLIGPGRAALEAALGLRAAAPHGRTPTRLALYLGTLLTATAAFLAWVAARGGAHADAAGVLALFLAAWPASEAVVSFVHRLLAESVKVQPLPRLDCAHGISASQRVLVVIPTLLTSASFTRELVARLEQHWLANREANAQFALLTDWADAPAQQRLGDTPLLDDATALVNALNTRYPPDAGQPARFLLIHRERSWSETQRRWIGWERKRGKLEQLVRWLATGESDGFLPLAAGMTLAPGTRYVLTLDSDTTLPPGALRELVAVAAHPLNTPQVDAATRRVVRGHAILQPRVVTPLPQPRERTLYQRMFAGQCGIDPYSSGVSDIYQDVFGTGSFSGKGLLHVQALHAVLDARLPEGSVLSHDLLEGTIARCGYVSDIVLIEDHPHHAGVADTRVHRWTRGDWQLLPLMRQARRYGIDALGLWKMADNLRRSLVMPASWALLVWVLFTGALHLGTALAVVGAALLAGPLMGAAAGLVPTRRGIAWKHFFHVGARNVARAVVTAAYQFSQLALQASLFTHAVAVTLARLRSGRGLLEWTTAAQAQAGAWQGPVAFLRGHVRTVAACALLAIASLAGPHPVAGFALFALWALAPLIAWRASLAPKADAAAGLGGADQAHLLALARDTWRYFERCVTAQDNHLPPDNLQMVPEPTLAHRTSPTNIGLYLLGAACAREFGWISTDELTARLDATLTTMERLPKHRGHLLNWYDTQTLQILAPAYVSTVDSGNLAGLLLAVAQACKDLATQAGHSQTQQHTLVALAARCRTLFADMDFSGLYDRRRHLFHIGLRVEENVLDASHYDLLASESRLTSLLAIAKGDVPQRHWQALSRPFLSAGVVPGLKSWSGSMFEYLMPALLMPEPAHGLLAEACRAAVAEQRAFGQQEGLPWGVSESAYFAQDHSLAFQYSPFGVPRLALRRTPPADRVVAPYATAMALMFDPQAASDNLRRLETLGARGDMGFYEAVDFTTLRQPEAQAFSLVEAFMAHHQGMTLASLCNLLCDQAPRRWFGADALVRAHASLLHERTPRQIIRSPDPRQPPQLQGEALLPFQPRDVNPARAGWQPTHLLSNGRYAVALRANGAGTSRWNGALVSRWRDDLLRDAYGTFFYLRRPGRAPVSLTAAPAPAALWRYRARFLADRVQYDAQGEDITTTVTVLVSPEDDTELRVVTLHNTGDTTISCEVVSCFEPVLADARADEAHPAFSGLFINSTWRPEWRALVMSRTPRLAHDPTMAVAHFLAEADANLPADGSAVRCTTSRRALYGRGRDAAHPAFDTQAAGAGATPPNGLDPVASLGVKLVLAPGAIARLGFATAAAADETALAERIDTWLQPVHVQRAARMAATLAQVRLRDLGISPDENTALQDLTTALMYTTARPGGESALVDQRQLWRFGISGDRPIVLVRIHSSNGLPLVHALLRAAPWWHFGGLAVDIVVLNGEPNSYLMPLQRDITTLRDRLRQQAQHSFAAHPGAGFHLLREQEVQPSERAALAGLARVVLTADGRPLDVQVAALRESWNARQAAPAPTGRSAPGPTALPLRAPAAAHAAHTQAPSGRFDAASGEFCFELAPGQTTPRPWVNVIANPQFGFQVSETGAGFTWAVNSRLHQLTHWSNDAVRDPPSEHWLLHDLDTQQPLALLPGTAAAGAAPCTVRHGQGYTVFDTTTQGLALQTTLFADTVQAVKVVQIRVHNNGPQRRRLRAVALAEWQLGGARGDRRTLHTAKHDGLAAVLATQREQRAGLGGATAFVALATPLASTHPVQWTCDRSEFFDAHGRMVVPPALAQRAGAGLDPCAALAVDVVLAPGESTTIAFVLGHAASAQEAADLARAWAGRDTTAALAAVRASWDGLLGQLQVATPDPLFDALVNRWLLYQTVACRMWSKAGFYQAGGAYGYRDQLQDAMALALADPAALRAQIVLHASRQFPEGDVQHWWHQPGGAGVRTHFSDDLLWLPYACAYYVSVTGDAGVLDEQVPFIDGPAIPEGAEDAYYAPQPTDHTTSVYDHCVRAIDHSLAVGAHGLPLMGTGDWNDGMNRVGHEGRGESVWLGWFLCSVVDQFAPLAQTRGDMLHVQRWQDARTGWVTALHAAGWDGAWFRRAFFDNGEPLGSAANTECRIDLIAQAWAVLSGASSPAYTESALREMKQQLVDADMGLIKLLAPPLKESANNPGYIQAYPRGVRENGGQYNHAAVWALMAQAMSGDVDGAWASFEAMSPAHRSRHPLRAAAYELEPYVMAGDIYGADPYLGRGGWSWYTGSAAWLYRASVETLLGLVVQGGKLSLSPRVPSHWDQFTIRLQLHGHDLTLRWDRVATAAPEDPAPTIQLEWGAWVSLADLPPSALLHISGTQSSRTSSSRT